MTNIGRDRLSPILELYQKLLFQEPLALLYKAGQGSLPSPLAELAVHYLQNVPFCLPSCSLSSSGGEKRYMFAEEAQACH